MEAKIEYPMPLAQSAAAGIEGGGDMYVLQPAEVNGGSVGPPRALAADIGSVVAVAVGPYFNFFVRPTV